MSDLRTALSALLRADQLDVSDSGRALHARGESTAISHLPDVVAFPESSADVQAVVRLANDLRVAVTPVGANSSLEGHTVPVNGGISLDLTRMDAIKEVDVADMLAVVEPGVVYQRLNQRLRPTGLFFPVDPGAEATLGGMASTNASGTLAVRYGVMRDQLYGLEVVLADGRIIRTGGRARKSSSGYDLTRLFCGAEGTLGIITELTLKLTPRPQSVIGARVSFSGFEACVRLVTDLIQAGMQPARCEFVDAASIAAINAHTELSVAELPTVFLEFHGANVVTELAARELVELATLHEATRVETAADGPELRALWEARHRALPSLVAAHPGMDNLITDLAVPISRLPDAVSAAYAATSATGLPAYVLGHVGDGNFHVTIFYPPEDDDGQARAAAVHAELVTKVLALGGTCTGEHGIGLRKLPYARAEHGPAIETMWDIKDALDPRHILNPGKKLPPRMA